MVGYGLNDWGFESRQRGGKFSLHHCVQTASGTHPTSYPMGTRVSFLGGVKRLRRKADHSLPSSAEVKNVWSYTSTPPIRLHGVVLIKKEAQEQF
jgi:hypothetical protein